MVIEIILKSVMVRKYTLRTFLLEAKSTKKGMYFVGFLSWLELSHIQETHSENTETTFCGGMKEFFLTERSPMATWLASLKKHHLRFMTHNKVRNKEQWRHSVRKSSIGTFMWYRLKNILLEVKVTTWHAQTTVKGYLWRKIRLRSNSGFFSNCKLFCYLLFA